MLSKYGLVDPMPNEKKKKKKRIDYMTRWPFMSLKNIFAYILERNMCDKQYTRSYKDKKAHSYLDSG